MPPISSITLFLFHQPLPTSIMNSSSIMNKNLIKTYDSIATRVQNAEQFY